MRDDRGSLQIGEESAELSGLAVEAGAPGLLGSWFPANVTDPIVRLVHARVSVLLLVRAPAAATARAGAHSFFTWWHPLPGVGRAGQRLEAAYSGSAGQSSASRTFARSGPP